MVFRHISEDLRCRALWLLENDYVPEDVAEILGVSERSISRWQHNMEVHGSTIPPPTFTRGRPRILDTDKTYSIMDLVENAPELYLDEIQEWVVLHLDTVISRTALHENIRDAGMTYKMLTKAALERDDAARDSWMVEMLAHWTANQVVVVDETSKDDRTIFRRYGRSFQGQRANVPANFVRGTRYSLVAAMSTDGYIAGRVVEGSVDGDEFFDFIVEDVLPKMNPYPGDNSVLIMDNCAIHKSYLLREVIEAYGCVLEFLPPYSPDFNPIEQSFSCVKSWIRRHYRRMQNAEDPIAALYEAMGSVTAEKARAWFLESGYQF